MIYTAIPHYLNRDTGDFRIQIQRAVPYEFSSQVRYFGLITRKTDGKQVRVALTTLRANLQNQNLNQKFNEWLGTSVERGDTVGKEHQKVAVPVAGFASSGPIAQGSTNVKTKINVSVNVQINQQLVGSRSDVATKLQAIIDELQVALCQVTG